MTSIDPLPIDRSPEEMDAASQVDEADPSDSPSQEINASANDGNVDDDEFGDFDECNNDEDEDFDFNDTADIPPTAAEEYVKATQEHPDATDDYVRRYLETHWQASPPDDAGHYTADSLLCTPCSLKLWDKLSHGSVFYNPITGAIGQFQWTRSETNRAYLNALGVTINYEDRLNEARPNGASMRHQPSFLDDVPSRNLTSLTEQTSTTTPTRAMSADEQRVSSHGRSSSLSGILLSSNTRQGEDESKKEEPELDIDIAKAYCELTEETIRVFPNVKLNAMVDELSRLNRQANDYIGYLLDRREKLLMDAETYNDLISCIVNHAQRLREQNATKDASPAMVTKKKKTGGLLRRKQNKAQQPTGNSASMGGGVVGIQQDSKKAAHQTNGTGTQSRRSM